MNKENIKNELITEVQKLLNLSENKIGGNSGLGKNQAMAEHMGKADNFSKKIVDLLNEILVKEKIEFKNEKEKDSLIEYLKPTIND
jgi:plasmid rolling circle replication initiator protein Rep